MGVVIRLRDHRHARAGSSADHKSGRSSDRGTPVSRSIGSTNSAGTPFLERASQYQTCDCVVPIRSASGFCPPATLHARFNASDASDMSTSYPNLGEAQPKNLSDTNNLKFGTNSPMKRIDKKAFGGRVKLRREKVGLTQKALGVALGVPQQTVGNWESGKVGQPGCINELAETLATTRSWLLWAQGPEEVAIKNPFEQIDSLLQGVKPNQAGAVIQFLKTLKHSAEETA